MRIAITGRFQNSYFSGALPQIATTLAKAIRTAVGTEHDVCILYPKGDANWFIDVKSESAHVPNRLEWSEDVAMDPFDLVIEATWSFPPDMRRKIGKRIALFQHYSPMFHDMESSVYQFNPIRRSFENVDEIWTWDLWEAQDIHYLNFISEGKPVRTIPFAWNFDAVDSYVAETSVPEWSATATLMDNRISDGVPKTLAWSARIVEGNISNTSHALLPLNIVSEIRHVDPIRYSVHNGEYIEKNEFFKSNVAKNLIIPDISGNFVPRIRLPDLRRDKSFIIAHQRFRPMKGFLLDALYCGIPVIHNCVLLKRWGYFYELNQIRSAVGCWKRMNTEYTTGMGFFSTGAVAELRNELREAFGLHRLTAAIPGLLKPASPPRSTKLVIEEIDSSVKAGQEIRVQFCDMWADFQPEHNFFMSLLKWSGSHHGFSVRHDAQTPNLIIYGPFGDTHKAAEYARIPKVFFTGENTGPREGAETFLNLGYQYSLDASYIRLPLWVLEINWFGENVDKIVNPRPVALATVLKQDPAVLDRKQKFCAFVATNPRCQNRNMAFHVLNEWRGVDSGGRLFCNLAGGPIPAGLGGGGGELAKLEFYKDYKYVIAFENESAPGYTTEKILHAKAAGCVPIYWGDKWVDRDFDPKGFLNANTVATGEDLIKLVEGLEADPAAWRKAAEVPALTEYKRHWCERVMEEVARKIVRRVLDKDITFAAGIWETAHTFHSRLIVSENTIAEPVARRIVSAADKRFVPSILQMLTSLQQLEPSSTERRVYVWPEVEESDRQKMKELGAEVLEMPVREDMGWADFWDAQHFAWKLWIHAKEAREGLKGTAVLYLDAGIDIVSPLSVFWNRIASTGACIINDNTQTNMRWCHPAFCSALKTTEEELAAAQIWAGCMGFQVDGPYVQLHEDALRWAKEHRDVIVGHKSFQYSKVCIGHRHDQSILSILTQRAKIHRIPIRDVHSCMSRRQAENWGVPLYVHRGTPVLIKPLIKGIDEAYVINLEHRKDRLESFKKNAPHLNDVAYVWKAINGRTMSLTSQIANLFENNDFKWKKSVMGCALSHFQLWQRLANDPIASSYLIMEDDVRLATNWLDVWRAGIDSIPADADVIYLGGVLPPNKAAFPTIVDPVSKYFARVAKNELFSPGRPRRYFHFCNYAYVMTRQGARKMMQLIDQKGIFTSGDHMIVNHGDGAPFNIYFTTPLVATCIQEDDPVYQRSEFNNFSRLDTFDSDLWNNNDHFTQEEIIGALADKMRKIDIKIVSEPMSEEERKRLELEHARKMSGAAAPAAPAVATPATTKEEKLTLWNTFLRAIALKKTDDISGSLASIFATWKDGGEVVKDMSWFRIFEQLILTGNPELLKFKEQIIAFLQNRNFIGDQMWESVAKHWSLSGDAKNSNGVLNLDTSLMTSVRKTPIYYIDGGEINNFLETEWINSLFPNGVEWKVCGKLSDIGAATPADQTPVLVYMESYGKSMYDTLKTILDAFHNIQCKLILLHISDEVKLSNIDIYTHPAVKHVLRNYWRPGLPADKVSVFPLGFAKGRSSSGLSPAPVFKDRKYVWSFAGSLDRQGRTEGLAALESVVPYMSKPIAKWGDSHAVGGSEYCEMLRNSKFVPCFRGFKALESFRVYEALEHGAIPVYVPAESDGCADEFREMYGTGHPFIAVPSWKEAASVLPALANNADVMEAHRQKVVAWWSQKKDELRRSIKTALSV
jgi:GR25 family glycosyltransferase involved in LPS biosynthesis